jgi:hypothetical protein
VAPLTEREWQHQVTDLARTLGYTIYHTQFSKWSESGWPDLALCRPPRLLLVELKSERGKVTEAQQKWLTMLAQCPGVEVKLWRPGQLDEIVRCLR